MTYFTIFVLAWVFFFLGLINGLFEKKKPFNDERLVFQIMSQWTDDELLQQKIVTQQHLESTDPPEYTMEFLAKRLRVINKILKDRGHEV